MPTFGKINTLPVIEKAVDGVYLDGAEYEDIFVSYAEAPRDVEEGETLDVFLYLDSGESVMATTKKPHALVGECASLEVLSVGEYGAFLDWGIGKNLLLPYSEQAYPVEEGRQYFVHVFLDKRSGRIAATTRWHLHFEESSGPFSVGDQVELLIASKSPLGYKAIFDNRYLGLIHGGDLHQPLKFGDRMKGWIKSIRDDGKVDLSINTLDNETRDELEAAILEKIKSSEDGVLALSDKSSPEAIFKAFKVSKKNFKRAISGLYKQRLILIEPELIRLSGNTNPVPKKSKTSNSPRSSKTTRNPKAPEPRFNKAQKKFVYRTRKPS